MLGVDDRDYRVQKDVAAQGSRSGFTRGTSLKRKRTALGPYRRPMPRVLGGSWGGGHFLVSEVPL